MVCEAGTAAPGLDMCTAQSTVKTLLRHLATLERIRFSRQFFTGVVLTYPCRAHHFFYFCFYFLRTTSGSTITTSGSITISGISSAGGGFGDVGARRSVSFEMGETGAPEATSSAASSTASGRGSASGRVSDSAGGIGSRYIEMSP
eukprot:1096896-Prorocentrum_minimum.AAC.2